MAEHITALLITPGPCCSSFHEVITDEATGKVLFQTEELSGCCSGSSIILHDAEEKPILTLHKNGKWRAYSGNGINPAARLFTIKYSGFFKPSLHVFVAPKTEKDDEPDFRAKESGSTVSIFQGRSERMVAQMKRKGWFSGDKSVWIDTGSVDLSFVCAILAAILEDGRRRRSSASNGGAAAAGGGGGGGAAI